MFGQSYLCKVKEQKEVLINTESQRTKCSEVMGFAFSPLNLFALKIAFLSQSVQYIQSSNKVILNGCFNFSGEYKITLKKDKIKKNDGIGAGLKICKSNNNGYTNISLLTCYLLHLSQMTLLN